MKKKITVLLFMSILISFLTPIQKVSAGTGAWENATYTLTESTGTLRLWTTYPTEKVFKDSAMPTETGSGVQVYAAKNEFEPFLVVVNPTTNDTINLTLTDFPGGITTEIYQVRYVDITSPTDYSSEGGFYPDPLWPIESGNTLNVTANENTAFWFNVQVPTGTAAGDDAATVTIDGVNVPIHLHVFDFAIPDERHIKSQMNMSYNAILTKYGVTGTGTEYWEYVQRINQFLMDHRLTSKSVLWPGGLTGSGAAPFIDYDCAAHTLSDPHGIWGFEDPAANYIDGDNFASGVGFPSFMAATFQNNDASADQRPDTFCGQTRSSTDWYTAANPNTPYNTAWFTYMSEIENYLTGLGYIDEAYYYFANEPQDQADYDAVAWYSQELKNAAPDFKLAVSEEPKPEIYDHPTFTGAKIDIWIAHYGYHWDPTASLNRLQYHQEETWLYWLKSTYLPYFNPFTIDHVGEEAKLPGWFFWHHRVRGMAYYSFVNWSDNPWTLPNPSTQQNGEMSMLYPPSEDNSNIVYGANGHRFVPSIRLELLRDGFEDYEYFYLLNGGQQPQAHGMNLADSLVNKIVQGKVEVNRDGAMMYNLRRLIGYYLSGDIASIPDIAPESDHPRADGLPGDWYLNFQDPDGNPTGAVIVNGHTYMKIGEDLYDPAVGYGWLLAAEVPESSFYEAWDQWYEAEPEPLMTSSIIDNWGRTDVFEFDLPNGSYVVTLGVGYRQSRTHSVWIEGQKVIDQMVNNYNEGITVTVPVTIRDKKLTISMGEFDVMGFINYVNIEAGTIELDHICFLPMALR